MEGAGRATGRGSLSLTDHAEIGAELSRLVASLAPDNREHFRRIMAEIIASCRASRPDYC
jgi:hypothetical protein